MNDNIVTTRRLGIEEDVVQINLGRGAELPAFFPTVEKSFRSCLRKNDIQLVVNMENIELPPAKFIALLVEVTNQARRLGGDVKLINLSHSAKTNLVTFSPTTYLSIEENEEYALLDFGDKAVAPSASNKKGDKTKPEPEVEISTKVEPPPRNIIDLVNFDTLTSGKIKVKSTVEKLYDICDFVTDLAHKAGFAQREIGKIKVTVYEACLNVVEHAYFSNPDNWIEVTVYYDDEKFIIVIHDWGEGFEFKPAKDYNVEQAVKDRRTGGFGLHIIQRSVDDIKYEANPELGNKLILLKYIKRDDKMA